ncbi:MAG: hypothetical protein ACRD3T_06480 [Terriglobia bacterium]
MYIPAWNATFAKPLLNQCIAIIQRDQASAISIVNPALQPVNEFHKGPGARTAFPWLTLAADATSFTTGSSDTRQSKTSVTLALEAGQFDQEMAQDNAQDYARVLDMVVTTASGADWITPLPIQHETVASGITTPPPAGALKDVFVESHRYSQVTLPGIQAPVLRVTLTVLFELIET